MVMGEDSCTDKEEGRMNQQDEAPKGDPSELTFTRRLELVTDSWESQSLRGWKEQKKRSPIIIDPVSDQSAVECEMI